MSFMFLCITAVECCIFVSVSAGEVITFSQSLQLSNFKQCSFSVFTCTAPKCSHHCSHSVLSVSILQQLSSLPNLKSSDWTLCLLLCQLLHKASLLMRLFSCWLHELQKLRTLCQRTSQESFPSLLCLDNCYCCCKAQEASRLSREDSGRPMAPATALTPSCNPNVCVMCGPLDDGGVPEECHSFLRAFPELLQCVYMMKVPVYLQCGIV